jgi:peptide chain release factor 1
VTVVAMEVPTEREWKLNENDILIMTTRDSGPGGQHRNKTESCVIMRHVPTGIEAKASARCQHQNKRTARAMLEARVKNHLEDKLTEEVDKRRQEDRGSGMRGDKVRTYRDKDDVVTDHRTENKIRLKDVKLGKLEGLWR